jgi:hypothetical protein
MPSIDATDEMLTTPLTGWRVSNGISARVIWNVPIGAPAFFYQWDYDNYIPEQFWIPAADQGKVPETQPDVIPTYKKA